MAARRIPRICTNCGHAFAARADHVKKGLGWFCSHSCSNSGRKPPSIKTTPRVCKGCNKPFDAKLSAVKAGNGQTCRRACSNVFRSLHKSLEERFWSWVDKTPGQGPQGECWEWHGYRNKGGYGTITLKNPKRIEGAHRVAYEVTKGPIPNGLLVRHSCDNPPCCNPKHLKAGTNLDNMRDRDERGRRNPRRGEAISTSKLSNCQVREIRARYARGDTLAALTPDYPVSKSVLCLIVNNKAWTHVI